MTSVNGSNVHEAFTLMATLLAPRVPVRYLELSGQLLQRRQMEEVFEERAAAKRCAFPACENPLPKSSGKFRVSLARKEIYDAQYERQFCSELCLKKARVLLSRLVHKPPQLVPSLVEVFGTDKPNPLDYEDNVKAVKQVETPTAHKPEPVPKAKTVWAKTQDLGVVERKHSMSVGAPPALEASTSKLKENASPAAPDRNFPTSEHASLIEGYVFPAHKQKLAKKVEKLVKNSQDAEDDEDIVVSDSDESDAAASDVAQVKALTKLDVSELQQLLQLFYEVRKDSDVAVDTDIAPIPESESKVNDASKQTPDNKAAFCRKCRRAKTKCVCETRAQNPKEEELSTTQLEEMLQEALVLREEYDELLQPDD
ncbi:hypothetical protein AM588_10001348 [Phytophthora nicotianae]|uniref:RNA polymerase II subunit B1 CTD phosphatase RPAP2 homolog n=1 Tax=Phytophthora nicotianae TaxID=4792 RepID=A0A0W8CS66_PHYNI|nr:hypothetical protein AM588_10001348 [Phytophthora nicotianae]